ncbi:MAG: hypothetical protein AAB309_07410, partial [Deltaproteobacteria bacterium]
MKIVRIYFISSFFFVFVLISWQGFCDEKGLATVLHCYDGDTCRVKTDGGIWFNVRLFGIDAQEMPRRGKKR